MPLETATYIDALVTTNPDGNDARNTADDHLRLIKSALRRTFPNVAGEISASHGALNYLAGVNQNIQVQFTNLREGSATARNAINARYASSASYAQTAGTASYALVAANARPVVYAVAGSDVTLTVSTNAVSLVEATLSASGYYVGHGMLLGYINNNALSQTMAIIAGSNFNPYSIDATLASPSGASADNDDDSSLEGRLVLRKRIATTVLQFPGPAPGTVNFAISFDFIANVSVSALPMTTFLYGGLIPHASGQEIVFKRGSYVFLERLQDSV